MPTYEYACRDCAQHVEVVQSFTDAPLTTCGVCGGQLRKVFSAAGIIFKGSGYYVTDSRKTASAESGGRKEPASADSSDKGTSGKNGDNGSTTAKGADKKSTDQKSSGKTKPGTTSSTSEAKSA